MRTIIKLTILLSLVITTSVKTNAQQNFAGNWHWETENATFDLKITQSNNMITGVHCAVLNNGDKIDCSEASTVSFNGVVQGDSIIVTFKSAYSFENGNAVIKKINWETIEWKITKFPSGEFYIPKVALLEKR